MSIAQRARPVAAGLLEQLRDELGAVRARVAALEHQAGVRADDDRALMRAIIGSVGAHVFSAGELVAHAVTDPELRAVLTRYGTAKRVGKCLRRIVDQPIAGFTLRRVGRDHSGTIWAVQVDPDLHRGAWPGLDGRV